MRNSLVVPDDPGTYSRPFKVKFTARLAPKDDELKEYICQENNPDIPHLIGPGIARWRGTAGNAAD